MTRACKKAGGINLAQGICDLPTHPLVQEGAIEAIRGHRSIYSEYEGILELRKAIAAKMAEHNRLPCDPEKEIAVTVGATGAFAMAFLALLEPDDEVVVFEPYYSYHLNTIRALRGKPICVTLRGDRFDIDEEQLRSAFSIRTKAIVVCTPSNPCGKVFTRHELSLIAELCNEHNIVAVTDEIYEYIVYDGVEHLSLATLPGMRERTVTISGLSKTFSITGWRLGYAVAPVELMKTIGVLNDLFYVCAPTPLQYGGASGLTVGPEYYEDLSRSYALKRNLMEDAVRRAGLRPIIPQGAYYMLADHSTLGWGTAREAARRLLETTGVATVPGSDFYHGSDGDHLLRFCFAKEDEVLMEAGERMARIDPRKT
jgi:aminotransferase